MGFFALLALHYVEMKRAMSLYLYKAAIGNNEMIISFHLRKYLGYIDIGDIKHK